MLAVATPRHKGPSMGSLQANWLVVPAGRKGFDYPLSCTWIVIHVTLVILCDQMYLFSVVMKNNTTISPSTWDYYQSAGTLMPDIDHASALSINRSVRSACMSSKRSYRKFMIYDLVKVRSFLVSSCFIHQSKVKKGLSKLIASKDIV